MTWLIPVHEDDSVKCGSDGAYACHYKRADKVREFISFIVNKSYYHKTIKKVYQITELQFRGLNIFDYKVLEKHGRLVWEKAQ